MFKSLTINIAALVIMLAVANRAEAAMPVRCEQAFGTVFIQSSEAYRKLVDDFDKRRVIDGNSRAHDELRAIESDPSGPQKRQMLEKLGYVFGNGSIRVPPFQVFLKRYNSIFDEQGIPADLRIQPAFVFHTGKTFSGYSNQEGEFLFVTPGLDSMPEQQGLRLVDPATDQFNLPTKASMQALRSGRWPMLDAFHDGSHFASFAMNPSYMIAVAKHIKSLPKLKKGSSLPSRIFMNLELLALADRDQLAKIKALLSTPEVGHASGHLPFRLFLKSVDALSESELRAHAQRLSEQYVGLMKDYGAGPFHSLEKEILKSAEGLAGNAYKDFKAMLVARHEDNIGDVYTNSFTAILPQKIRTLLTLVQKELTEQELSGLDYLVIDNTRGAVRANVFQMLRERVALAEYVLWNTSQFTAAEWVAATVSREKMDLNSPAALLIRDAFSFEGYQYRMMERSQGPTDAGTSK
ncbi:MAG: hypothetical protein EOP06_00020 [Proteobacteria bacterium]|nr:MAG: hypothetical protein EOP06_00020 [Pseudomonadota bacterium]